MLASQGPFIVAAYIPCQTCSYGCVIVERFDRNPTDDELDRHPFQAACDNCGEMQVRVGRDAIKRTVVEWTLKLQSPPRAEGTK